MNSLFPFFSRAWVSLSVMVVCILCAPAGHALPNADIVFVGQVPNPTDFTTANSTFGNHLASIESIVRGGDLFIRYRNGTLKNLTRQAGFGNAGFQGANAIAVRDPSVSWDGSKVIFSMVVGAPAEQYQVASYRWQLYEITGLGASQTPVITKVPRQPEGFNNINPVYGSDDTIFFTTDRPRNGASHLYPQRDEYESAPTVSGLWNLNPQTGELRLLDHAPSGVFEPIVDSFGRIIYTRWDHLQRDQQADATTAFGAFTFSSEEASASRSEIIQEIFPEPRVQSLITDGRTNAHSFNHFFPWQINQDGTGHETLNHIGRHELHGYFDRSFNDDDNLQEQLDTDLAAHQREILNFFHIAEDPVTPGRYFGIDAPEFTTHAAGQVVRLDGPPTLNPDLMPLTYVTDRSTANTDASNLFPQHSGLYRDPLPVSDGSLVAAHTTSKLPDDNIGTEATPVSRYSFRLKTLTQSGASWQPNETLTSGINVSITYYTPDILASYSGPLWELQPVELAARARPSAQSGGVPLPEQAVFSQAGVDLAQFQTSLAQRDLALIVMRDVTTRDRADLQQPFNLRVLNGIAQTLKLPGKIYDISFLQLFQGDQIRGYGGTADPDAGRRVLAHLMHDGMNANPSIVGAPQSSVRVASDGSVAAIVPARRALTWQLTNANGSPVVRERYWLTFQPGEIRVCASCHGVNSADQTNQQSPTNQPQALAALLEYLKQNPLPDSGESPPDPTTPTSYTITARGPRSGGLKAGRSAVITASVNQAGGKDVVNVNLTVNGRRCSQSIGSITLSSTGTGSIRGKAPAIGRRKLDLIFSASQSGVSVAQAEAPLSNPRGRSRRVSKLSRKDQRLVCEQFSRFR